MRFLRTLFLSQCFVLSCLAKEPHFKTGLWHGELELNSEDKLPFQLDISKEDKQYVFTIKNAEERIRLSEYRLSGDTLIIDFPAFHSSIFLTEFGRKSAQGYWRNYNKSGDYRIPLNLSYGDQPRFGREPQECLSVNYAGNWKTTFDPGTSDSSMAIGIFEQQGTSLTGTFRTETGDYRFLEGNAYGTEFLLSCFDGSHAFLLKATYRNDSLLGTFYSGTHYKGTWNAVRDSLFTLRDPDSITYVENTGLHFEALDMQGDVYRFPEMAPKGKVVIIQIMGTWCPNCMDEVRYYQQLYAKYHDQGLEIITVAYEVGETFEDFKAKIDLLQARYNLPFTFLIGGKPNKSNASKQFSDLNEVISFPTSVFIGRDGTVKRVHTGFNGPGTGSYYEEYVQKTNALIEELLAE